MQTTSVDVWHGLSFGIPTRSHIMTSTWNTEVHPRVAKLREVIAEQTRERNTHDSDLADNGFEVVLEAVRPPPKTKTYYKEGDRASEGSDYLSAPAWQKDETR